MAATPEQTTEPATEPAAEADAAAGDQRGRNRDKELLTMERVCRSLDELDTAAARRAVAWLASRYGPDY